MTKKLSNNDLSLWNQIKKEVKPLGKYKISKKTEISELKSNLENNKSDPNKNTFNENKDIENKKKGSNNNHIMNQTSQDNIKKDIIKKINDKEILFTGIHRKLDQKMSRGHIIIDDTLDLHGMTQKEAQDRLIQFLINAKKCNYKIALVITGKGLSIRNNDNYHHQEKGVLNTNLPIWLQHENLKSIVNGYRYANQRHGGKGAYYILLKS
jgi:DNA-nicking Smr family endonuclease|tara:strand:+ start:3066 stop:3695 length:630 start_codon:yes stop_codon:yes gene_type:complete